MFRDRHFAIRHPQLRVALDRVLQRTPEQLHQSLQTWQETLVWEQATGATFASYTTAKTVLPTSCLVTLPANWWYVGRKIRVTVVFGLSNRVTGPDTTTFQVNIGAVAVWSSGAINLTTTANTLLPCKLVVELTCRVTGTSAALLGVGVLQGLPFNRAASQANSTASDANINVPITTPANGTTFDSTAAGTLDFFVAQSVNNVGNGIAVYQYHVEALN